MRLRPFALYAIAAVASAVTPLAAQITVLDDFTSSSGWSAHPSDGTTMSIRSDSGRRGRSLRIDYAFSGGGYAIVRREMKLDFPANYDLSFWIRGNSPTQNLELKLVDSTGDNVWWRNQRDFDFPRTWRRVAIRKRHIEFAWGPLGGGELRRAHAIEIAITARAGGRGTVWIDDLELREKPASKTGVATVHATASSTAPNMNAKNAVDGDTATLWASTSSSARHWVALDFGGMRELGGLIIDWAPDRHPSDYDVQTMDDGAWRTVYSVRNADGNADFIYLPESETPQIRIIARSGQKGPIAVRDIAVQPVEWSATKNSFFTAVAGRAPRGEYPKYFSGTQSYWTIVGLNGDNREALLNEQGALEADKRTFSVEPFLFDDGRLLTWADVVTTPSLEAGYLPIPSVAWRAKDLRLTITTFADRTAGRAVLWARYRLQNVSNAPRPVTLFLALRPFQVNPPAQFLNTTGGSADIRSIAFDGQVVRIIGHAGDTAKSVIAITKPTAFGATTFDAGGIVASLRQGRLPKAQRATDALAAASGALSYELRLPSQGSRDIWIAMPWDAQPNAVALRSASAAESALARNRREWMHTLDRVQIDLPPSGARFVESLKANLAFMLITRDGPALQPGARAYERAWIRDGAMMATALLRLGRDEEARAFADWYAPFQYPNGKVPCCVDTRGADPVPENDSHGQLIYLAAEIHRYTADTAFLKRMWPHVVKAVTYIDSLRGSRMTAEFSSGEKRAYYGLVPQSISHEGYSAKPMHSYWDDMFTLLGLKDAVYISNALGYSAEAVKFARSRDEFRRDVMASYRLAIQQHKIDYLPGAVELGDFDATSTTVGVTPGGELASLPQPALERTFEKYYTNFRERRTSTTWDAYTPYELRVVGTMVRLGWKDRAHELLDFFFKDQRPSAWRAWAEVVYRDTTATRFIGDLPHTWVGSDYIRSALDMLAYDRESDSSMVIGAGVPESWVRDAPGVIVRGLRTPYGSLSYSMRAYGDSVMVTIEGGSVPPGGFVIRSPLSAPLLRATVDGHAVTPSSSGDITVGKSRAQLVLSHSPAAK